MRIRIWLGRSKLRDGREHRLVGSSIVYEEGENIEERKVIEVVQNSLAKHFPDAQIILAKSAEELFGE